MKTTKIVIVLFFIVLTISSFSQDISFYIQIEDTELIPEVIKDNGSDILKIKAKTANLDNLYH